MAASIIKKGVKMSQRRSAKCLHKEPDNSIASKTIPPIFQTSPEIIESCNLILKNTCALAHQFQKHSCRDRLTTSDINKASHFYLSGNNDKEATNIIELESYIEETETHEEVEKLFYCGKYLHSPDCEFSKDITNDQNLMSYFELTMLAILSNNSELFTLSLRDLKRNHCIMPLLPVFIDSICQESTLLYQPTEIKKFLQVLHSLYLNPNIYFQNKHLYTILNFAISYATNNLNYISFQEEDLSFRDTTAVFIGEILTKDSYQLDLLYNCTVLKLSSFLKSPKIRYRSCYGAISALIAIGLPAIEQAMQEVFLVFSKRLLQFINMHSQKDAMKVREKLLDCCEILLQYYLCKAVILSEKVLGVKLILSDTTKIVQFADCYDIPLDSKLCISILNYFGNEIYSRLPALKNESEEVSLIDIINMPLLKDSLKER